MRRFARAGVVLALTAATLVAAGPAHAWPSAADATIRPGAPVVTVGSGCTANFVFYDLADVYLGYAAHCAQIPVDGVVSSPQCGGESRPLGTLVEVEGATKAGRLAYSSWETMHRVNETDEGACFDNDFALIRLDPADRDRVNPTVPFWGGPTGRREALAEPGEKMVSYGNSDLRQGIEETSPREGLVALRTAFDWTFATYFATPGIFGDSGSAVLDAAGAAAGVLVAINSLPPGANGSVDLHRAVSYMRSHGGPDVRLALGTEPFRGPLAGPGLVDPPAPLPESPLPVPPEPPPSTPAPAAAAPPAATPAAARKPAAKRKHRKSCRRAKAKRTKRCRAKAKRRRR